MWAVLARYRREWAYALRRVATGPMDDRQSARSLGLSPTEARVTLLQKALQQLPGCDSRLIEGIFLEGKSEATVATFFGISQQAVNKRKHVILKELRSIMIDLSRTSDDDYSMTMTD
jgi:DNA-directed RNA polymerase specialized sigma24 family protein